MKLVVLGLDLASAMGGDQFPSFLSILEKLAERDHDALLLQPAGPDAPPPRASRARPWRIGHYSDPRSLDRWRREIVAADAVIVDSGLSDGAAIGRYVHSLAHGVAVFLDRDTPATLARLERGDCDYLTREMIAGYDLYLASAGGEMLDLLEARYGSPAARTLANGAPVPGRAAAELEAYVYEARVSAALALSQSGLAERPLHLPCAFGRGG